MRLSIIIQKISRRLILYKTRLTNLRRKLIHRPQIFDEGYYIETNTLVTLYTDQDELFPDYEPRVRPSHVKKARNVPVVLIAVAKNEEATAREWFEAVLNQMRLPDEIVIVDTGSTDGTVSLLTKLAAESPIPMRVIEAPGKNIAQGRNLAIQSSQMDLIAVTDFGTKPRANWLELLVLPFEIDVDTEVSGGWYDAVGRKGEPYRWRKWISLMGKSPQDILSPSVSIAFTRAAWTKVGGYPEWLTLTGEDTYLDMELRRVCLKWAFSPEALVDWEAPDSIWAYWKKMYRWSIGDGETGMRGTAYWYAAVVSAFTFAGSIAGLLLLMAGAVLQNPVLMILGLVIILSIIIRAAISGRRAGYSAQEVVLVIGILAAQAVGFIRGAANRLAVTRRRVKKAPAIYFILAGIPIDDTGGGARSTQIALELLRRQYVVCYVNKYPRSESVDLNLMIRHPNLFTLSAANFSLHEFTSRYNIDLSAYMTGVVVELPHQDWLPILDMLRAEGAKVVYELIDDWDSKLGEGWYSRPVELQIIERATALTATAPILKTQLENFSQREVCLLPNAVNKRLFNHRKIYPIPVDLPDADMVITYIGALYGDWFDWELLNDTARAYPQASVVIIGDYRGQCPNSLPNIRFLGLKPQTSLPGYLAHTDIAIIPWKVNEITKATSPLKLYEYLAMHVPVVVPNLPPLLNIPSVYPSTDKEAFLRNIQTAMSESFDVEKNEQFIRQNSWESRVEQLISLMDFDTTETNLGVLD